MAAPACSDEDFVELFEKHGAPRLAEMLKISERAVRSRRVRLENKLCRQITSPDPLRGTRHFIAHPERHFLEVTDGVIVVASDAHYWPGYVSTAHKALVKFLKRARKVKAVIMNGDALDGASISRHAPISWEENPSLIGEIEECGARLDEIRKAAPNAEHIWTLGNHDGRFETRLATVAPEFAKIHGVHLKDHFPHWVPCWSTWINEDVVVKHRFKGGIHATHNNTIWAGKTVVTGHLHSLKVTPFSDYNGIRWGVDTGTLADPYGPQFRNYMEDNPRNWRSGFAVLTFENGQLRWPEIVHVVDEGVAEFRGETFEV